MCKLCVQDIFYQQCALSSNRYAEWHAGNIMLSAARFSAELKKRDWNITKTSVIFLALFQRANCRPEPPIREGGGGGLSWAHPNISNDNQINTYHYLFHLLLLRNQCRRSACVCQRERALLCLCMNTADLGRVPSLELFRHCHFCVGGPAATARLDARKTYTLDLPV